MPTLDGAQNMQDLTDQILTEAEHCMARGDLESMEDCLSTLAQAKEGAPLLGALCAVLTSLDLRRERIGTWVREARKNAAQPILEAQT